MLNITFAVLYLLSLVLVVLSPEVATLINTYRNRPVLSSECTSLLVVIREHNTSPIVYPSWVIRRSGYYLVRNPQAGVTESMYLTPETFYQAVIAGMTVTPLPQMNAAANTGSNGRDAKGRFVAGSKQNGKRDSRGRFVSARPRLVLSAA